MEMILGSEEVDIISTGGTVGFLGRRFADRHAVITRTLRLGDGGEQGHEAGKAKKLGDKNGGVGLSLVALDTMKRLSQYAILSASLSKNSTSVATHPPAILIPPNQTSSGHETSAFGPNCERE
ncbi:hypothetical protein RHGRI_032581 [Rhododendron griersonianum]|uniref:Uncharacterized protein n=1 Tax=Rhododendron griersonianum TaxID=479676 RepID=A0AAV6ICB3_9ERIC|nr:hypothetical protein RHGRI_032581 [Rhododendron griersonianum]